VEKNSSTLHTGGEIVDYFAKCAANAPDKSTTEMAPIGDLF